MLDLNMPGRHTLEVLPELSQRHPGTAIVVVTMAGEPGYAMRALAAGAGGYVLKDGADHDIVAAVRCAVEGERFLSAGLAERVTGAVAARGADDLSLRQLEILRLLALGHTNLQISRAMSLSTRTIETHRARIQAKLGGSGRHRLVEFALDRGLIGPVRPGA